MGNNGSNNGEEQPKCPNGHPADSAGMCRNANCPYNSLDTD